MQNVINPYDGSIVDTIPDYTEQDVRDAISRAKTAAPTMEKMPAFERADILNRAAELIAGNSENLATLMAKENGKPIRLARGEVSRAVETVTFAAEEARRIHGETVPMDAAKGGIGKIGYYVRVPIGVVAAITPFNFPLNLVVHKVAPAIAAGCPIALKPSPATPLTALRLQELLAEAGLPDGAFEVVTGDADVGTWLTTDPRIAMISFTGSPPVAHTISKVSGLRRTAFELGGNAATVVEADANLDQAIDTVLMGGFAYSGQVCNSVQRIYVHENRYAEFRDKLKEKTEQLHIGDPLEETTDIGPMISDQAADRVESWIADAVNNGAAIVSGGKRDGRMFQPTILENVQEDMSVMCQEVFGPLMNIVPFNDFDDVLERVNDTEYGLAAGVYTNDITKAMKAIESINTGGVMINHIPQYRVDHMPYGGNKNSGVGREGPRFAIEEMTTLKMVVINTEV